MDKAPILDHLAALGDVTRCRMLLALERQELTVSELCAVVQLPQSTVSRHLKTLLDESWLTSRRDGTSRLYTLALDELDPSARRLWLLVRDQVAGTPAADQDHRRLRGVLAGRRRQSEAFFSSAACRWDKVRDELFGSTYHLRALVGLADPAWVLGDLGCGTGQVTEAIAPYVQRVIAVDGSGEMLKAARRRLKPYANVDVQRGELEALPIEDGRLDVAVLLLVLHHVAEPANVLREAARVLRPGGRLLIGDMLPHDREQYRQQMGHVWLGFSETQMQEYLEDAGFGGAQVRPLAPDPVAKGPALFVATATRQEAVATIADRGLRIAD
jgi:ubiquinone/menaquinone biosynthesis C-methylase UbiE/DNA-binding transcriptional ArsR family regulator